MRPAPIQRFGLLMFGVGFLVLFGVIAVVEGVGAPTIPAGDVALVEGVSGGTGEISMAEYHAALAQTVAQGGAKAIPRRGSEAYEEARKTAMERLLKAAWVRGAAAESEIGVTAAQVRAAIAAFKQQQRYETKAEFERFLSASHLDLAEFKALARLQILSSLVQEHALESVPPPSDADVSDYYEAARNVQFTTAPTYDLRLIVNRDRGKAARAKAALENDDSPATWKRVASLYTEDPRGKKQGGLYKGIPAEFGEPMDAAVAAAPVGKPQGIVEEKKAFFVFQVEGSKPGQVEPLAKVRSNIVAQLSRQQREAALEEFASEFESKWTARTHCAPGFEVQGCTNFRGTGKPANAPSACYEAHPKAGIAAPACPAPVSQSIPALPGTVTVFNPKGTALPQRPRPAGNP